MASISLTTLAYIAAGTAVAGAGVAAYESRQQGIATDKMDRQKARVEAMNETQKQITMRQNMLRALASQNAVGAGVAGGRNTSFGANVNRQITEAQNDLMVSKANSSAQVSLLDQAGANASASGSLGAIGDVLGGAKGYAQNAPGG